MKPCFQWVDGNLTPKSWCVCKWDTSGAMAWIYHLFSVHTFNQASSCSGGGAGRAAQISAGGIVLPRGVLVWPIRHTGLAFTALGTGHGFERLHKWVDCSPASAHFCDTGSLQLVVVMGVCCPTKQKAFLQLEMDGLLICWNFVVLQHGHAYHEGKKTQNQW